MAKLDQFPPPEVRASASLRRHHTRRQRREESQHLRAPQLLSKQCAAASICSVELEYILRQIESDSGNLRHDRLTEWIVAIPPWHIDAVGGRLHHQRPTRCELTPKRNSLLLLYSSLFLMAIRLLSKTSAGVR